MFEAIYEGMLLGLVLAMSLGPGFFALINTGIKHGFQSGASLAFGIFLSDLALVLGIFVLLSLGAQDMLSSPKNQAFIGVIGGIVLIVYGIVHFYSKPPKPDTLPTDSSNINHLNIDTNFQSQAEKKVMAKMNVNRRPNPFLLGVKGFFLNLFNPFVWIFWLATATAVSSKFEFSTFKIVVFFLCTLGVVLGTDIFKTYIANKIKKFLTNRIMKIFNIFSGVTMVCFGLYLIYRVFFLHP